MAGKTYKSAVVVIPPEEAWPPIQDIRRQHDRNVRRWMPHVTMLYPFRPAQDFDVLAGPLAEACRAVEPFELQLTEFHRFRHGRSSFTIWLAAEPADKLRQLQEALWYVAPDCDEVRRFAGGFTPHLSVGQARSQRQVRELLAELQANWQPVRFRVEDVKLMCRNDPPDDVFGVARTVRLGSAPT